MYAEHKYVQLSGLSLMIQTHVAPKDGSTDPIKAWETLGTTNILANLAILLLNFVPNSASNERLFSVWNDIKTKKRTRLGTKKTRDTVYLKFEIRREHAQQGLARKRLKRQFGNTENAIDFDESGSRTEEIEILRQVEEAGGDAETESTSNSASDDEHLDDSEADFALTDAASSPDFLDDEQPDPGASSRPSPEQFHSRNPASSLSFSRLAQRLRAEAELDSSDSDLEALPSDSEDIAKTSVTNARGVPVIRKVSDPPGILVLV